MGSRRRPGGGSPIATLMKALGQEVQALLHAAQQDSERQAALDPGRVDVPGGPVNWMLRTEERLIGVCGGRQTPPAVGGPHSCGGTRRPQYVHAVLALPRRFNSLQVQPVNF